jgi:predicted Rossmann fold nucleotide-binding protein DprA/Smf involved in DNA uptake|tara:strand:- start:1114 stop:1356 length:243 start_codon:yes stop_codon:yes gene_type:complete
MGFIGSRQYSVLQAVEHVPVSARGISAATAIKYGDVNKTLIALHFKGWVHQTDDGAIAISSRGVRTLKNIRKGEQDGRTN